MTTLQTVVATGTVVVDIIVSVCHVILQDHVLKGSFDSMGGNPHVKSPLMVKHP